MEIKILGSGCPNCKTLEKYVNEVVAEMSLNAEITKVDDIMEILKYGVARTPALVVNGNVIVAGRLPSKAEINQMLTKLI